MTDTVIENPTQMIIDAGKIVITSGGSDVDTDNTQSTNTPTQTEATMTITETISGAISDSVTGTINQARQAVLKSIWKKINSLCKKYDVSTDELINNIPHKSQKR